MNFSICYINDVHGYLEPHNELFYKDGQESVQIAGGYAAIATTINKIKNKNPYTLVFDGGDTFHGTLPVVQSKGEAIIPVLNSLNIDAMTGHWDFAYGPVQLKKLLSELSYPLLGINVFNEDDSLFLQPWLIKNVGELKVGIIGICSNIIDKTMPKIFSQGLKITNGEKELPVAVEQVKSEGADIIILLSHNGFPQDMALLEKFKGIDICLSAHTHNRLYEPIHVGQTIIIQCGCHGSFLGHLTIKVDRRKITDYKYELINISDKVEPDFEMEQMINEIMYPYDHLKNDIVGETGNTLHRYNTLNSTLDELLLKSIAFASGTEIAFSNGWRYGAPIAAGQITKWDLYNIVPMNPVITTAELKGSEIIEMLEENLENTFSTYPMRQKGGYVKRCTGLKIYMRIENPEGHRIQEIYFHNEHLERQNLYTVSYLTSQSVPDAIGRNRKDLDINAVEAMERYLNKNGKFYSSFDNTFNLI